MAPLLLPTPHNQCHIQACAVNSLHDDDGNCGLPPLLPATRGHHLRPNHTVALGESPQRRAKACGVEPVISFQSNTMPTRSCAITNPIDRGHRPCPPLLCHHQEKVFMLPSAPEFWECRECWEHIRHFWSLLKLQLAPGDTWSSSLPRTNIGIHECCRTCLE